jgi:hypothetical protein
MNESITIREGQAVLAVRLSPASIKAFEAYRQKVSEQNGRIISRNELARQMIEQQLVAHGELDTITNLNDRKKRTSIREELRRIDSELQALKQQQTRLKDDPPNQQLNASCLITQSDRNGGNKREHI